MNKNDLVWKPLLVSRALWLLHSPRYAGVFSFGRTRQRRRPDGHILYEKLPRSEWTVLIQNAHPGYISWEQFEENLKRLRETSQAYSTDRKKSPPREGPALLQGMVLCGRCGDRMTVRYYCIRKRLVPHYVCQREGIEHAEPLCQSVPGAGLERAIGSLLVDTVTPLTLEVSLAVGDELFRRRDEAEALRRKHVERLRYEADLARRRYLQVDPDNRLVADELEGEWNEKLKAHRDALDALNEQEAEVRQVTAEQRARVLALAQDFPRVWNDPRTPNRERKRMVRLLLEDVTLVKGREITAHVRFKGGTTQTLTWPLPPPIGELRKRPVTLVAEVDRLLDDHTWAQIATILTSRGMRTTDDKPLDRRHIRYIQEAYGLVPRYDRLRARGMLTIAECAERLTVSSRTIKTWNQAGFLTSHLYNDKNGYLIEPPGEGTLIKNAHKGLMVALDQRRRAREVLFQNHDEVQYGV
jgi:hypothetical protein